MRRKLTLALLLLVIPSLLVPVSPSPDGNFSLIVLLRKNVLVRVDPGGEVVQLGKLPGSDGFDLLGDNLYRVTGYTSHPHTPRYNRMVVGRFEALTGRPNGRFLITPADEELKRYIGGRLFVLTDGRFAIIDSGVDRIYIFKQEGALVRTVKLFPEPDVWGQDVDGHVVDGAFVFIYTDPQGDGGIYELNLSDYGVRRLIRLPDLTPDSLDVCGDYYVLVEHDGAIGVTSQGLGRFVQIGKFGGLPVKVRVLGNEAYVAVKYRENWTSFVYQFDLITKEVRPMARFDDLIVDMALYVPPSRSKQPECPSLDDVLRNVGPDVTSSSTTSQRSETSTTRSASTSSSPPMEQSTTTSSPIQSPLNQIKWLAVLALILVAALLLYLKRRSGAGD